MIFFKGRSRRIKERAPLPPRLARLLRESRWLLLVAVAFYLILVLATYDKADPGWSHSAVSVDPVHNAGGRFGAWLADLLLYLFGVSAYWTALFLAFATWWGYRHIQTAGDGDRRPFWIASSGFVLLLLSSACIEALRLHSLKVALPLEPGGAVGMTLGQPLFAALGYTGATLTLLIAAGVGLSLFTGLSWLSASERIGEWVERSVIGIRDRWHASRDRQAGVVATQRREEAVEEERRILDDEHVPLHIEPPQLAIKKSERVKREKQQPLFEDLPDSPLPPLALLDEPPASLEVLSAETLEFTSRLIEKKLLDFGISVKVVAAYPGPVITRYEIEPAVGVKGSQIVNLVKDLARALSVVSIRVVETIPGKSCMGLEIPNPRRQTVRLSEILSSQVYGDMHSALTLAMGKDIAGKPIVADLARMPHLLVAGTTGSGKSVAINAMILSLLYKATPNEVRLILVDPKMLELSVYEGIPHLLAPVVTDMKQASHALNWCVAEMERRYKLMSALGVRNLPGFNQKVQEAEKAGAPLKDPLALNPEEPPPLSELPLLVVVIDELADLMMVVGKKVEELIARLAQKARAAGIHLILATQRPSVDVITGLIKANIPTRVAFQVSSKVDSRTILDQMGAEALLGQGDMLYLPPGTGYPQRVHGAFVADAEVHKVVEYLKSRGTPQYIEGILEGGEEEGNGDSLSGQGADAEADPLYDQAVEIVLKTRRASISLVQRHLRIGYNRAARLIEAMERAGLVSSMQTNGNREVLVKSAASDS
ncbi:MAG TPA: DNA translocase FtsK 4TM domain-containing protein [Burkholderiales bacterium]|nr:DNA translocase FtsK 4TM domain-containing protein [Burkholderiales bacterium]